MTDKSRCGMCDGLGVIFERLNDGPDPLIQTWRIKPCGVLSDAEFDRVTEGLITR